MTESTSIHTQLYYPNWLPLTFTQGTLLQLWYLHWYWLSNAIGIRAQYKRSSMINVLFDFIVSVVSWSKQLTEERVYCLPLLSGRVDQLMTGSPLCAIHQSDCYRTLPSSQYKILMSAHTERKSPYFSCSKNRSPISIQQIDRLRSTLV